MKNLKEKNMNPMKILGEENSKYRDELCFECLKMRGNLWRELFSEIEEIILGYLSIHLYILEYLEKHGNWLC